LNINYRTAFMASGPYGTGPITLLVLFLVSHFNFLFVPCGEPSWLPVSFLLHVKYTLSYLIVFALSSMRIMCANRVSRRVGRLLKLMAASNAGSA